MKKTKEQVEEYMAKIRRILVLNPQASIKTISEKMVLNKDYVNKLVNKVRKERANRLNYYTVNVVLARFEDLMSESDYRLWQIINNPETKAKIRVAALRELRQNNVALFDKMFDAGVFKRSIGELDVRGKLSEEQGKLIDKALELLYGNTPAKLSEIKEEQGVENPSDPE